MGLLDFSKLYVVFGFINCRMNHRRLMLYYICVLLYGMNRALAMGGINFYLVRNYLSDLVFLPVLFTTLLLLMQKLFGSTYLLSKTKLIFTFVIVSLLNEWMLPLFSKKYTADSTDVVCYFIGMMVFIFFMNRPSLIKETSTNF